ncbi:hypothetical protein KXD96_28295 (plasmid) [Mycobacterium sp. SMC-2]|uniref:hypothetical protein n=1 Tax=Mycobacterium sp. SMC-2 TaxID=2857058 RepID=UPI0021B1E764|nr:hypothetical protein [Mycobacterium sp. SMC-2]UXA06567.1 hypothetical protein KXD96_27770 [Mycobacterium sp. SMC-2]UXA09659.1 hypothetical protein KXD96_28295 [Mycobacterium sp. SMC-2]
MLQGLAVGQAHPNGERSPGFIEYLEDAKLGRTRLGESARRSNERTTPLLVRLGPDRNATRETQWKGSPSELLDDLHATLARWVEVINVNAETLSTEASRG